MRHELLRKEKAQAVFSATGAQSCLVSKPYRLTRYALSHELPQRAQARLMQAAAFSQALGYPINTHLTINAAHLQRIDEGGVFGLGHLWDGFQTMLELARKWLTGRGIFWAVIWSREWSRKGHNGQAGEHWHIALHLPKCLHSDFAKQVAEWTGAGISAASPSARLSAVAIGSEWHIGIRHGRGSSENLAAYLGKAEPGTIKRYGRRVPNLHKPQRGLYGGSGPIEGKRFGICKTLGATEQERVQNGAE